MLPAGGSTRFPLSRGQIHRRDVFAHPPPRMPMAPIDREPARGVKGVALFLLKETDEGAVGCPVPGNRPRPG